MNTPQLVRSITLPLILTLAPSLFSLLYPLPVIVQLLVTSASALYVGSLYSASVQRASYIQVQTCELATQTQKSIVEKAWDILKYPLMASITLLFLYFLIGAISEWTLALFLDLSFILITAYHGTQLTAPYLHHYVTKYLSSIGFNRQTPFFLSKTVTAFIFLSICFLYAFTKHWILNNIFALVFAIYAVKSANIHSFKVALPVLWVLFFYDLFWVYSSQIMVTVAQNIQIPIKLKFPYFLENEIRFSMLGLGDIIIPGLFISLCLKCDIDTYLTTKKPKNVQEIKVPLFQKVFSGYVLAILSTYLAMYYFQHPQPALVFIVPICSLAFLVHFLITETPVWSYSSQLRQISQQSRSGVSI